MPECSIIVTLVFQVDKAHQESAGNLVRKVFQAPPDSLVLLEPPALQD